ncbi:MAG: hypothetical protein NC489_38025, partial [Ruminococcus flavefaciens]|nr:hypothetical protein [Ruminococcus flavefaciens]
MSKTLKDTIFDKITDEILDAVVGFSKQELQNFIDKNKKQKILMHCIKKFANSDFFKREYKDIVYILDEEKIMAVSDNELDVSLQKENLSKNIEKCVINCFVSDDDSHVSKITEIITEYYIQHANVTIGLYDIIKNQHIYYEDLGSSVSEVKKLILENKQREQKLLVEKESLLKKELDNEIRLYLSDIMNKFLFFMCKESPQLDNPSRRADFIIEDLMCNKIEEIVYHIDNYVREDFCDIGVNIIQFNENNKIERTMNYFQFMECVFKAGILENTQCMLQHKDIIDLETYICILKLRNYANASIFPSLIALGQGGTLDNKNMKI